MGMVYRLADFRSGIHGRASAMCGATSRAAKRAKSSAVTPAALATDVPIIEAHHSDGMRSRCDHLGIAVTGAPVSLAIAPCEGQSAITARNDVGCTSSDMDSLLGQFVLNGKANVSGDCGEWITPECPMAKDSPKSAFKQHFLDRITAARVARDLTQDQMAELLGIAQDKYKQYERRSFMPHDMIPRFMLATGVEYAWLYTGKGKGPDVAEMLEKARRQRKVKPQRKIA